MLIAGYFKEDGFGERFEGGELFKYSSEGELREGGRSWGGGSN